MFAVNTRLLVQLSADLETNGVNQTVRLYLLFRWSLRSLVSPSWVNQYTSHPLPNRISALVKAEHRHLFSFSYIKLSPMSIKEQQSTQLNGVSTEGRQPTLSTTSDAV
jgi:hypothetical protein